MTQHALQERTQTASSGAWRALLPDGRQHFQHGPIDLVIGAEGEPQAVAQAFNHAWARFTHVLPELVEEIALLRRPVAATAWPRPPFENPVAQRMFTACWRHRAQFVTPMAAVAGSVADEILATMLGSTQIARVHVNNGGDIALHLGAGQQYTVGLLSNPNTIRIKGRGLAVDGRLTITPGMGMGGIATSGWRGRSQSLGIADSVTVFAAHAAQADVAATLIANQVNVSHDAIERVPANSVKDDTDLGERRVTVAVGALPDTAIAQALQAGEAAARTMQEQGLILGAVLVLQGQARFVAPSTTTCISHT